MTIGNNKYPNITIDIPRTRFTKYPSFIKKVYPSRINPKNIPKHHNNSSIETQRRNCRSRISHRLGNSTNNINRITSKFYKTAKKM
jgi:hypothetical protein